MPSKAFKLAEAMVSNPVMSDMVENPTATPTQIAAVETKTATISNDGVISVSAKNITSNNTLTQSFDSNQTIDFNLTDSISSVSPLVSVFKEVPQPGVSSKGNWDVNANATNYEFFDEKPISYSSTTLTPSATGDGTFTSSTATSSTYDISSLSLNNTFDISTVSVTANGTWFKSDGTVMYIHDNQVDTIIQYPLTTAWDLSTVGSTTGNFAVGSQDTNIRGPAFNSVGTIMYVGGFTNDKYFQYTLSTAWDITTASYSNKSVSFSGVDAASSIMHWKSDGTSFFCTGSVNDRVYRWDLTTAWDISTASNVSNFDISSVFNIPYGVSLNSDGTKMFIMGRTVNSDYELRQYSLSTAYDITTATYDSVLWDWVSDGSQSGYANGHVFFGSSGTRLYLTRSANNVTEWISGSITAFSSTDVGKKVVGNSGSAIITSTAGAYKSVTAFADTSAISSWQLFGAQGKADGSGIELSGFTTSDVYNLSSPSFVGEYTWNSVVYPTEIGFSTDGTKCFYLRNGNDAVYHATLSTPFNVSTISNVISYPVTGQNGNPRSIWVKEDGTSFMVVGTSSDRVYQWNLSSAWDLSSGVTLVSTSLYVGNQSTQPNAMDFNSDGTKLYIMDYNGNIYQYGLTTGFDISTASYDSVTSGQLSTTDCMGMRFNSDGTKVFVQRSAGPTETYNLSPAYDITSATLDSGATWNSGLTNVWGISFSPSGHYVYLGDNSSAANPRYKQYTSGTGVSYTHPYSQYYPALTNSSNGQINSSTWQDINSMAADETKNDGDIFYAVSTDNRTSWGVAKGSDGVRKIARNNSGTWQYNNAPGTTVTIGYDLANGSFTTLSSHLSQNEGYMYMHLKPDGTKVWVGGQVSDTIFEYDIGTAFDLSTVSYGRSKSFSTSTQSRGFFFKPDGTRAYISDRNNYIRQLNMNTAWNISTAQSAYGEYNMSTSSSGIFFKPDGTKFYNIDDGTGRELKQFSMSTAWDVTTASLDYTVNLPSDQGVSNQGVALAGNDIWFSSDGTYFFLPHFNTGNPVAANSHIDILKGVAKFSLSTAWDISSTITYLENIKQVDQNGAHLNWSPNAVNFNSDGSKMYTIVSQNSSTSPAQRIMEFSTGGTTINYNTNQTWANGTTNNEHATLQQALGAQAFNRMNKAQLDAVADGYHFSQDSADTLDLMIAPYAASGSSPISDGVTINYDAEAIVREAIGGTDYVAEFPNASTINIKSLINGNMKIRAQ